jgi:hypothetical protein
MKEATTQNPAPNPLTSRRIRLELDGSTSEIWSAPTWAPGTPPTTDGVRAVMRAPDALPAELEAQIVWALQRPVAAGETHASGNDRREREVAELFAKLSPVQALQLRRRLEIDRADDRVAVAFKRLVVERRDRLRAFLRSPRFR